MGRKPNQLILEFFDRGQKLEDASNRYQHTCKSCGEKFPKGRIDSLTNHLIKRCPAIPMKDRQRALLQLHELPDLGDNQSGLVNATTNGTANGQTMVLPYPPNHAMSALETLAEVSRQHLDLSGKLINAPANGFNGRRLSAMSDGTHMELNPDDFLVQHEKSPKLDGDGDQQMLSEATNGAGLSPIHQSFGGFHDPSSESPHLPGLSLPPNSAPVAQMVPSPLAQAASLANELQALQQHIAEPVEPDVGVPNAGISDRFLHPQGRGAQSWANMQIDPALQQQSTSDQQLAATLEFENRRPSYPRPIAMNPNQPQTQFADYSMGNKVSKPKVRGRFSDSRRKEVQGVRKMGACIRCRMLKKPCSGESPCSTCVNVESARIWKYPCTRTKVAAQFNLYSAGLYAVLAFHETSAAKNQGRFSLVPGRIEATHYLNTSTFSTFTALRGRRALEGPAGIDPTILRGLNDYTEEYEVLELIDQDTDDVPGKLEKYMRTLAPNFIDNEPSNFVRPTLSLARRLMVEYKDGLLHKVTELWIATHILTSTTLALHLIFNQDEPPSLLPTTIPDTATDDTPAPSSARYAITPTSRSHALIRAQFLAAIEKRCAVLSKSAMNELERRLLQRRGSNHFLTFLAAVILLLCVERTAWLFKTWEGAPRLLQDLTDDAAQPNNPRHDHDHDHDHNQDGERNGATANDGTATPSTPARWPLDKPPQYYSQQGERFSDLLDMLLKLRGLPPKTTTLPDGRLGVIDSETTNTQNINNNTINGGVGAGGGAGGGNDSVNQAKLWLESVGLGTQMLLDRVHDVGFDERDERCWELRWVGKLLLPAG